MLLDYVMAGGTGLLVVTLSALVSGHDWTYACLAGGMAATGVLATNLLRRRLRRRR